MYGAEFYGVRILWCQNFTEMDLWCQMYIEMNWKGIILMATIGVIHQKSKRNTKRYEQTQYKSYEQTQYESYEQTQYKSCEQTQYKC